MLVVDDSLNFPFESKDTSDRDIGRNNVGKGFTTRNVINTFVGKVKFAFEEGFPLRTHDKWTIDDGERFNRSASWPERGKEI